MSRLQKRLPKSARKPLVIPLHTGFVIGALCFSGLCLFVMTSWRVWSFFAQEGLAKPSYAAAPTHRARPLMCKKAPGQKSALPCKLTAPDCARANKTSIQGAFRELNCRISWRRTIPQRRHPEDLVLRKAFRKLHTLLRTKAKGWRTIYYWQNLYKLGTRLYPLENRWATNAVIPVYEVNGHHKSLPFWIKEAMLRKVGPLFHLDAHADMESIPSAKRVLQAIDQLRHKRNVKQAWHTIAHSIDHCSMPVAGGVLAGAYKRVIWGTPAWLNTVEFVNRMFFFALPKQPNPLNLDDLPQPTQFEASPYPFPFASRAPANSTINDPPSLGLPGEKWRPTFQLYYDPKSNKGRPKIKDAGYWHNVTAKRRPHSMYFSNKVPIHFSVLLSELRIDKRGVGTDARHAQNLLKAIPKGVFTLDIDLDYFASIDLDKSFRRTPGQHPTWDSRAFKNNRVILAKRLKRFQVMLQFLQEKERIPALITIADSTFLDFAFNPIAEGQSEYAPLEHAAFVRKEVRKILRHVYKDKVNGRQHSKRPPIRSSSTIAMPPASTK